MMRLKMEPKVIFEDGEIMVLDKPAGLVVNRRKVGGVCVSVWLTLRLGGMPRWASTELVG